MEFGNILLTTNPWLIDAALLMVRVCIGVCFVTHALGKLGIVGPGNMAGFAAWLEELGVPFAPVQARMAMLSELVGGTCLALGLFTRPACVVLLFTMLIAGWLGHRGAGYLITNDPPGAEYTINLAVICLAVVLIGPGGYSADAMLF